MRPPKQKVARILGRTRVSDLLFGLQRRIASPFIRCVNYHDVPERDAHNFERQLQIYANHFDPVGYAELTALAGGSSTATRPGLVLSFDDGLRSHAEVVAPLLERYGFVGWFMVPGGFVDAAPETQHAYAAEHDILHAGVAAPDRRLAMTWQQVRDLRDGHVIGCHTWTHRRLTADLTSEEIAAEIPDAKRLLEERLGCEVPVFCWVGGEEWAYSATSARAIREAGFTCSFMTNNAVLRPHDDLLHIDRTNIEAVDSDELVRFQLSGIMDVAYTPKRRRVRQLTAR